MTGDESKVFSAPRRRQHRLLGWAMRLLGTVMSIFGALFFIAGFSRMRTIFSPLGTTDPLWYRVLMVAAITAAGAVSLLGGRRLRRRGRRHSVPVLRTMADAKRGAYVLYLRPFTSDATGASMPHAFSRFQRVGGSLVDTSTRTVEERISQAFGTLGRVIAVGQPDESLPLLGAARLYLPLNDWQPTVASLIEDARLVLLAAGTSEGTLWELRRCLRRRVPQTLLITIYDERDYATFRDKAEAIFQEEADAMRRGSGADWHPPRLPAYPPLSDSHRLKWLPVPRGYIRFDADWTPHLVRLDPTSTRGWTEEGRSRRMNREQLVPFMEIAIRELMDAEDAADQADASWCMTIAGLEAAVRAARSDGADDQAPVSLLISGTGRFLGVEDKQGGNGAESGGGDARDGSAIAQAGGRPPFTLDLPLPLVEDLLRERRAEGARDADTLQVEYSRRGRLRGVGHNPGGPAAGEPPALVGDSGAGH
ncbi:hypothetical protein [Streptomyces sp. MB09-02B]|uniref:hypothetical protein n=1 Tax=Streptomyces sp. MB09-02B TaxID=3028667 RepID=UPI0029B12DEF|nr:hypothetical protein [Streptomyces sp. MB09-02B]MDX3642915.1 hypothetical protein [Streptomyces sp. MB09-02B]